MLPAFSLPNNDLKPYERAFRWKKRMAFVVTSLTAFCLLCFLASLSIQDYETVGHIDISASSTEFERYARRMVEQEIADSRLSNHVAAASANTGLVVNNHIDNGDLNGLRQSLDFSIAKQPDGQRYRLNVQFQGIGSEGEKFLVGRLLQGIASRLSSSHSAGQASQRLQGQTAAIQERLERVSFARHADLNIANDLLDNLNAGLSGIHGSIESLNPLPVLHNDLADADNAALDEALRSELATLLGTLQSRMNAIDELANDNEKIQLERSIADLRGRLARLGSPLQQAASGTPSKKAPIRVVNSSLPERDSLVNSVLESLNALDTDSIQARIGMVQQNLRSDAIQLREDIAGLQSLSDELAGNRVVVESVSTASTRPVDSSPGLATLLLCSLVAVGFGATIAAFHRPELDAVGFDSVEEIERSLGVPVSATIGSRQTDNEHAPGKTDSAANSMVRWCEIVLFAFVMLIGILCFTQADVRTAFLENPFYGLAKLAEIFFGR